MGRDLGQVEFRRDGVDRRVGPAGRPGLVLSRPGGRRSPGWRRRSPGVNATGSPPPPGLSAVRRVRAEGCPPGLAVPGAQGASENPSPRPGRMPPAPTSRTWWRSMGCSVTPSGRRRRSSGGPPTATRRARRSSPTTTRTCCHSSGPTTTARSKIVFPLLRQRCPSGARWSTSWPRARGGAGQAALARRGGGLARRRRRGAARGRDAMESLRTQLVGHLDKEEASACPWSAQYLSAQEWGRFLVTAWPPTGGQGLAHPRADPRAHERRAAGGHAGPHAAPGGTDVDGIRRAGVQRAGREVVVEVQHRVP